MAYEHKDTYGSLFKNDKKQGNQPDYRGDCKLGTVVYEIGGWIKKDKNEKSYMSLRIQPARGREDAPSVPDQIVEAPAFDDDIPF